MFWNVAGLEKKDEDFWKGLKGWNVVVLVETWVDGKGWERMREKLPRELKWEVQLAKKEGKRGRPKGGMLMGIRREWMEKGSKIEGGREGDRSVCGGRSGEDDR